jgi:hypothetical protein
LNGFPTTDRARENCVQMPIFIFAHRFEFIGDELDVEK